MNSIRISRVKDRAKVPLALANMRIGELSPLDPVYWQRVGEFNQAMIEYYKGKWYGTSARRTRSKEDWAKAFGGFHQAQALGELLLKHLESGDKSPLNPPVSAITPEGTEIKWADGVPLVPEITPVVMLKGTDREMGYQYATQLVQIYGKWILERHAGKTFTDEETAVQRRWEEEHAKHTPWLIEFCRGWSGGATDSGVSMSYEDVADLWFGHTPPARTYLNADAGIPELPPLACSGVAAWGTATKDGKLVTGSSGDHDMGYQITVVAFPEDGNSFVYSAFGATGDIPAAGGIWFFGHPGMNSRGVAYVHHGGGPKFLDAKKHWGYGIKRAASVMHVLRYADTAREAKEMELNWPIGDVGNGDQTTVGGFYADDTYGYVIEGRRDPVAIRETGLLGERDFLYSNNSAMHPEAAKSEWMSRSIDEWSWDKPGGWRPKKPVGMVKSLGMIFDWFSGRMNSESMITRAMMFSYWNSYQRNQFLYRMMDSRHGTVDYEYMKGIFEVGGTLPAGPWGKITKDYVKEGKWGEISSAHASNAIVATMKPSEGLYAVCAGPVKRGLAPLMPTNAISVYGETNAFWEIKIGENPEDVAIFAREKAEKCVQEASELLRGAGDVPVEIGSLLDLSMKELSEGKRLESATPSSIYDWSRMLRCYTRAQVRAGQVIKALVPRKHA
ncbi:MAG: hypothetical protein NTV61_10980 [Candidatus Bathyarchaeota archaeon]|nr:hypothetical protein [Candidatus Bathyarchaeota archaeon]